MLRGYISRDIAHVQWQFSIVSEYSMFEANFLINLTLGCKGPRIENGLWPIEWSCDQWRHMTLNSQGHPTYLLSILRIRGYNSHVNKKDQLSLTNPRDAQTCQKLLQKKLLQFDVLTTLLLTILAYLHAFSCCCVRNLRNPEKFTKNSNLWSSRSSNVIDLDANRKPICDLLLVINSNFSCICYRFRDIHS